jgi:hypothetical protein
MPVRNKDVEVLAYVLDGPGPVFNSLNDTVTLGGQVMSYDAYKARYDGAYVKTIDAIDWNRLMLEASSRHLDLEHEVTDEYGLVCPECICEALLSLKPGGWNDWASEPLSPRS